MCGTRARADDGAMEETHDEMTRDPSSRPAPASTSTLPPPAPWRLLRSRDRVLGGVCSGIAASIGVDVTLVRLAFIAAGLSGFGVLVYLILWLVVPKEDPAAGRVLQAAPAETAKWFRIGLVVGAAVGLLGVVGWPLGWGIGAGSGPAFALGLILIAVGIAYLVSRRRSEPAVLASSAAGPWAPPSSGPVTAGGQVATAGGQVATAGSPAIPAGGGPARDETSARPRASNGLIVARVFGWVAVIVSLFLAASFAGLVAVGVLSVRLPVLVGLVGLAAFALLVGTTAGARTPWPILVSMALVLGAAGMAAGLSRWDGGIGERIAQPATVAEVQPTYDLAIGRRVVDLTAVDVPEGGLDLTIDQGLGQVEVVLPADAAVVADVHIDGGEARVLGRVDSGLDVDLTVRDPGTGGTVDLRVDLTFGQVVVCRPGAGTGGQDGCGSQS